MVLHKLNVVIWKNLIIRKRHWFLTTIEACLPVCLFFLIAYGRSKITGLSKIEVTEPTYTSIDSLDRTNMDVANTYILYTPNTEYFSSIISKMNTKLEIPSDKIRRFGTQEELLEFYHHNPNYTTFAIIFDDKDPKKFNYKLRYHEPNINHEFLSTGQKYYNAYSFEPNTGGVYKYQPFIPIQKTLDLSFIEYHLNIENIDKNITILTQEFPYPPHKKDSSITTIFLDLLPLITLFSFIFICPAVLKRVVEEKHLGTKELMKMVGMKSWMLWLGWFIYGIIPMITSVICIVLLMKVPIFGADYPLIEHSDPGILLCFLLLYCSAAIAFCFAISTLFNKPTIALVTGILIWILSFFIPKYALGLDQSNQLSWSTNNLLNLLPNMSLHFGYLIIAVFEQREIGVNWSNFNKSSTGGLEDVTMANIFAMLLFDTFFYTLFSFYMDGVNPGKYGVRRSFLFPIFDLIKIVKSSKSDNTKVDCESVRLDNVEEGQGLEKGIEINHLCKRYGPKVAVHNLDLNIYKNQITVLLGHNGAGKSTTMSMITGMIEATSGSIKINGWDIKQNMDEIRSSLGLCPQHNLLFNDLTVKEHLLFFSKLKGTPSADANIEADELLTKLNMADKKDSMAHTLSGGMQRKLCLGMALVGGSKVLILDEPSSGMDPESRRHLWDLLLRWRGGKTILITTHFMEEADALGDWIAIMSDGTLKCYGTPLYLKKEYDTGYHLSLMVDCDSNEREDIISKIKTNVCSLVADAQLKSVNGNNIVFVLPFEQNTEMTNLLENLEKKKGDLKIDNISVTITTLEDVFLKTRAEDVTNDTNSLDTKDSKDKKPVDECDTRRIESKMKTLSLKKYQFFIRKQKAYFVPIIIALIFFGLTGYLSRSSDYSTSNGPEFKLSLRSYGQTTVFYNGTRDNGKILEMMGFYDKQVETEKSLPVEVNDIEQAILEKSIENIAYYKKHMVAAASFYVEEFSIQSIALYNAMALHSLPISVNLITDSLAKTLLGPEYSISLSNWPLPSIRDSETLQSLSLAKVAILWLIMLPVGCLFIHGSFIIFPHTEISTKFVRIQYMCGVNPMCYWLNNFLTDLGFYMVLMLVMSLFLWIISPMMSTFIQLCYLYSIFVLYGLAGIPFAYLFSRKKSVSSAFTLFIIMGMFLGIILTVTIRILIESQDEYYINIGTHLKYFCFLFIPQVGLTDALVVFAKRAVEIHNFEVLPDKIKFSCSHYINPCCEASTECDNFKNYTNVFNEHLLMIVGCFIYLSINMILDTYMLMRIWAKILKLHNNILLKINPQHNKHESIAKSKQTFKTPSKENGNNFTLEASELRKSYSGKQIVKSINLILKERQCMGILGVNGAGKTTTFRMLTREEVVDDGLVQMMIGGKKVNIETSQYMEELGYCPQADSLNFVLTGREILTTIASLRGINNPKVVDKFLDIFELQEYADKPCGHYSGGNKRKLSLAVSLIGYRKFVLLDEPTNGVDPSSRRKCWEFIKAMQRDKQLSFILTSHSMAECEALCNELKIMKNGEFVEEGNLAELKNNYGGFSLKLKLCNKDKKQNVPIVSEVDEIDENATTLYTDQTTLLCDVDEVDGSSTLQHYKFNGVEDLKNHFTKGNRGEIKDEHSGLLHFYIKEKDKRWSQIFKEVEDIKASNPHLIEDYAISEASLEDIFLKVARENNIENIKG